MSKTCGCGGQGPKLVFACSGAADTAEIADQAARELHRDGAAKMYCLAGIGGGLAPFIETAKASPVLLAIDGCPQDCAKHTLETHGVAGFQHLRVTDLGFEKGRSAANGERIETVYQKGLELLAVQKGNCRG